MKWKKLMLQDPQCARASSKALYLILYLYFVSFLLKGALKLCKLQALQNLKLSLISCLEGHAVTNNEHFNVINYIFYGLVFLIFLVLKWIIGAVIFFKELIFLRTKWSSSTHSFTYWFIHSSKCLTFCTPLSSAAIGFWAGDKKRKAWKAVWRPWMGLVSFLELW